MDDLKKLINDIVKKISTDKDLQKLFKKDPVKAIEKVTGLDLPDEAINNIIAGVKTKLTMDAAQGALNKALDMFNNRDKK